MLPIIILVFFRIIFFVVLCPIFSSRNFPSMLKVAMTIFLTVIAMGMVDIPTGAPLSFGIPFVLLAFKEAVLGFTMGYLAQLVFVAVEVAGQMVDFQVGFTMAQVYDATFQTNVSQFGKIYYWLAVSIFFILNMHHYLIKGIIESFQIVPVGTVNFSGLTIQGIIKLFSMSIEMAINLAAPIIIVLIVVDVLLGILARTVPQINLLLISLPLKTGISIFFAMILLPNIVSFLGKTLPSGITYMYELLHSL